MTDEDVTDKKDKYDDFGKGDNGVRGVVYLYL